MVEYHITCTRKGIVYSNDVVIEEGDYKEKIEKIIKEVLLGFAIRDITVAITKFAYEPPVVFALNAVSASKHEINLLVRDNVQAVIDIFEAITEGCDDVNIQD